MGGVAHPGDRPLSRQAQQQIGQSLLVSPGLNADLVFFQERVQRVHQVQRLLSQDESLRQVAVGACGAESFAGSLLELQLAPGKGVVWSGDPVSRQPKLGSGQHLELEHLLDRLSPQLRDGCGDHRTVVRFAGFGKDVGEPAAEGCGWWRGGQVELIAECGVQLGDQQFGSVGDAFELGDREHELAQPLP